MLLLTTNGERHGMAAMLALCCSLFVVPHRCEAQGNIVPNPSFEELEGDCDSLFCCFNVGSRPLHWFSWQNSPDYFNSCIPGTGLDSLVDVPQNGWTYQYPWEGNGYVGVYSYDGVADEYREYVGAALIEPLVVGCTYHLRFRTNPAYGGNYWLQNGGTACSNIGMLLTTASNAWPGITGPPFPYRNFAHLRTLVPVADTAAWTLVEGTITADSAYSHVVLGNFFPDSLTTAVPIGNPDPWTGITYYLFDGVEVVPADASCHGLGFQTHEAAEPQVRMEAGLIQVEWQGVRFEARLLDMAGRIVVESTGAYSHATSLREPRALGAYVLYVQGAKNSFFRKFVVQ